MKICLVRHGETAWSLTGQHTGLTDLGLTPHGQDESRALPCCSTDRRLPAWLSD